MARKASNCRKFMTHHLFQDRVGVSINRFGKKNSRHVLKAPLAHKGVVRPCFTPDLFSGLKTFKVPFHPVSVSAREDRFWHRGYGDTRPKGFHMR